MPRKEKLANVLTLRLTDAQVKRLKRLCRETGLEPAEVIRESFDRYSGIMTRAQVKKFVKEALAMDDPFGEPIAVEQQVRAMARTVDDSDRALAEEYERRTKKPTASDLAEEKRWWNEGRV